MMALNENFGDRILVVVCGQQDRLNLLHETSIYWVVVVDHALPSGSRKVTVSFRSISECPVFHISEQSFHFTSFFVTSVMLHSTEIKLRNALTEADKRDFAWRIMLSWPRPRKKNPYYSNGQHCQKRDAFRISRRDAKERI